MNCENFEEILNAEMDNLLSPAERQELVKHLESCRNCRKSAETFRKLKELFPHLEQMDVPEGFTERVMARIRALPSYSQRPEARPVIGFSFGLAMVASIAALFFIFSDDPVNNQAPQIAKRPTVQDQISIPVKNIATANSPDFQLVDAQGKVQVLSTVGFVWSDVAENMVLRFGDKIRTLANSKVHLKYTDKTQLKLSSNTLVQVQSNGIRVFQGDSWVKVVKKGKIFEAWTPNLVASVRGTIYDISVRSHQRSYEDFLNDITQKNLMRGLAPEAYFQGFSLQTLNEAGSLETSQKIDSKVRVFESSVGVAPLKSGIPEDSKEVVLKEGQSIKVNSVGDKIVLSRIEPLSAKDFKYWNMEIPAWVAPSAATLPVGVPVPPMSSPRLKQPTPRTSKTESVPTFDNFQDER